MKNEKKSVNYKIAMTGAFAALSVILSVTPLGYISIGFISLTIMHIPAILATILAGLIPGMCTGLIFGITSLIRATMTGGGGNPFFLNPAVSVLPRFLFPLVVWLIFKALDKIPKMPKVISGSLAAAFGTFAHTMLVMLSIYIIFGDILLKGMQSVFEKFGFDTSTLTAVKGYFAVIVCMMATNGIWEVIGAVVICAAVLASIFAVSNKKSKLRKEVED